MKESKIKTREVTEKSFMDTIRAFPFMSYEGGEGMKRHATQQALTKFRRLDELDIEQGFTMDADPKYKLRFAWNPRKKALRLQCLL